MTSIVLTNGNKLEITEFYIECNSEWILNEITLHLTYINNSRNICQGSFIYPVVNSLIVSKMIIRYGNNVIEAQVTGKDEEDKYYENEEKKYLGDLQYETKFRLMEFHLGNLSPKSEIKVEITYISQSEFIIDANKYKIHIPKILIPRYTPPKSGISQKKGNPARNGIVTANIKTPNTITLLNSNIPNSKLTTHNDCLKTISMNALKHNSDLNIFYQYRSSEDPIIVLQQDPRNQKNAFHVSFSPQQISSEITNFQLKGEFIILLHCYDDIEVVDFRIAQEAAELLIKSLPEDSYFNVISFDSNFERIFDKSEICEEDNVLMACNAIKSLDRNAGGIEILLPIESILSEPSICGYRRHIFIITNGDPKHSEIDNENEVVNYIKNKQIPLKINTIGIGSEINTRFLREIANAGHGSTHHISNAIEIQPVITSVLENSRVPGISNIEICNSDEFELISPKNPFSTYYWEKINISEIYIKIIYLKK